MAFRKSFYQSERVWLREKDSEIRKIKRKKYIVSRSAYANAVTSSKRFLQSQRQALEDLLDNSKKWWREVKKLGISSNNPSGGLVKSMIRIVWYDLVRKAGRSGVITSRRCCKGVRISCWLP